MKVSTVSIATYIAVGAELNQLGKMDLVKILTHPVYVTDIKDDQWVGKVIRIKKEDTVEYSNPYAKVTVGSNRMVDIVSIDSTKLIEGIVEVLEAIEATRVPRPSINLFTSLTYEDYPNVVEDTKPRVTVTESETILPLRVGQGKRKSREDVERILSPHLLSPSASAMLNMANKEMYEHVKRRGGSYTDPLTDVVITCSKDTRHVIIEADSFSLALPARKNNGYAVPYTMLASVDARNVTDLQEIAAVLHAIYAVCFTV